LNIGPAGLRLPNVTIGDITECVYCKKGFDFESSSKPNAILNLSMGQFLSVCNECFHIKNSILDQTPSAYSRKGVVCANCGRNFVLQSGGIAMGSGLDMMERINSYPTFCDACHKHYCRNCAYEASIKQNTKGYRCPNCGNMVPEYFPFGLDSEAKESVDDATLFKQRVVDHLARVKRASNSHAAFIRDYLGDNTIHMLALVAKDRMKLTQADNDDQNYMVPKSPICYVICTLPVLLHQAAGWFERKYGGYTKVLDYYLDSDTYKNSNCKVLCHITYGRKGDRTWVNMTIVHLDDSSFTFKSVIAIDLMSRAEKKRFE
jgi:hypothetical protein